MCEAVTGALTQTRAGCKRRMHAQAPSTHSRGCRGLVTEIRARNHPSHTRRCMRSCTLRKQAAYVFRPTGLAKPRSKTGHVSVACAAVVRHRRAVPSDRAVHRPTTCRELLPATAPMHVRPRRMQAPCGSTQHRPRFCTTCPDSATCPSPSTCPQLTGVTSAHAS